MRRNLARSEVLACLICVLTVVVGCTPESTPSPSDVPTPSSPAVSPEPSGEGSLTWSQSQPRYEEAVAKFPYALAPGFAFPAKVPSLGRSQENLTGAKPAYLYWACANVASAWDRADAGDIAGAEGLLQEIEDARADYPDFFTEWQETRTVDWSSANDRDAGESGLCIAWLERLSEAQ